MSNPESLTGRYLSGAAEVVSPNGRRMLVDGGPSPSALTSALGREMPFWDRSLDLVIMTHPDADHVTGLAEVLDRYQVDGWLDNGQSGDDSLYSVCMDLLEEKETDRRVVRRGCPARLPRRNARPCHCQRPLGF